MGIDKIGLDIITQKFKKLNEEGKNYFMANV